MSNTVTKELPKITYKQRELVDLLYQYRFLNRIQLQAFIRHKDYKRINVWLKDLTEKQYIERIYSTDFTEKTKPAVYYLGINGIRYIRAVYDDYPDAEIRKRYRERERSQTYINSCSLIADCALALDQYNRTTDIQNKPDAEGYTYSYFYETEADYLHDSFYHELAGNEYIRPQLCIGKMRYDWGEPETAISYLVNIIDPTLPRYRMRKRLSNYIEFLSTGEWEVLFGAYNQPVPTIRFICPRTTDLIYAKRHTRHLLAEEWDYDDEDRPHLQFTTADAIKKQGFFGDIWEEA